MKHILSILVALTITTSILAQNNVITYKATNRLPQTLSQYGLGIHTNAFQASIISHNFKDGEGEIIFNDEITSIGDNAFFCSFDLTEITIPNSVISIGAAAFSSCKSLISISIPNSVQTIKRGVFNGCESLTSIKIPNSIDTLSSNLFSGCTNLSKVDISESVKVIEDHVFRSCSTLDTMIIPNSVEEIGEGTFSECYNLRYVLLPKNLKVISTYTFLHCKNLSNIIIPNQVTKIEESAFSCCGITSIKIPNSITIIGYKAFLDCPSLEKIEIGSSVNKIDAMAFCGCKVLKEVYCFGPAPEYGYGVFDRTNNVVEYVYEIYINTYNRDATDITIRPISCQQPSVVASSEDATVTWYKTYNAHRYVVNVYNSNDFYITLAFDNQGNMVSNTIIPQILQDLNQNLSVIRKENSYQCNIKGLYANTFYDFNVIAKDELGVNITNCFGNFSTTGGTGLNTLPYEGKDGKGSKYLHNGQLIIDRNGQHYSATGQKLR